MSRARRFAEELFVFTAGPVILFLFHPRARVARWTVLAGGGGLAAAWWSGFLAWLLGALVALIPAAWMGGPLTAAERAILQRTLTESVDEDHPTYRHAERTERRALRFAAVEDLPAGPVAAAAWLHDAGLDHPAVPEPQRLCGHGVVGAILSMRVLMQLPERRPWAAIVVADAVARHVAPTGFNWEWQDRRWLTKACPEQRFPRPVSGVATLVHDVALMDVLTVEHALAEAARKRAAEPRADLQKLLRTGTDSVLKEVSDSVQVLKTRSGKACGRQLARHVSAFIRGVDFRQVRTLDDLSRAAAEFLSGHPQPACLEAPGAALVDQATDGDVPFSTGAGPDMSLTPGGTALP